jgi:hypothetical protein
VDPDAWDATVHDPMRVLSVVPRERLDALVDDAAFLRFLSDVREEHQRYLDGDRWFQGRTESPLRSVAYFSPEFGIAEALPQYSGGLGVLAGDHLKAGSDLGVPLVGVGLFYRHGYFRQSLSADGWQEERYPDLDPHGMALTPCEPHLEVDLAGQTLVARIWRADVGRIPLYLLDADLDENPPELRDITDRLYGGETEHRSGARSSAPSTPRRSFAPSGSNSHSTNGRASRQTIRWSAATATNTSRWISRARVCARRTCTRLIWPARKRPASTATRESHTTCRTFPLAKARRTRQGRTCPSPTIRGGRGWPNQRRPERSSLDSSGSARPA